MAFSKGDIAAPFIQVKEDENGVLQDIKFVNDDNFVIGAICSGPIFLAQAGLLKGKKYTDSLFVEMRESFAFIEENNFLPPDNYQEDRKEVIAKRTSPTNIGLRYACNCICL